MSPFQQAITQRPLPLLAAHLHISAYSPVTAPPGPHRRPPPPGGPSRLPYSRPFPVRLRESAESLGWRRARAGPAAVAAAIMQRWGRVSCALARVRRWRWYRGAGGGRRVGRNLSARARLWLRLWLWLRLSSRHRLPLSGRSAWARPRLGSVALLRFHAVASPRGRVPCVAQCLLFFEVELQLLKPWLVLFQRSHFDRVHRGLQGVCAVPQRSYADQGNSPRVKPLSERKAELRPAGWPGAAGGNGSCCCGQVEIAVRCCLW